MPSSPPNEDLLDLRMLPAWANEPARPTDYADFEGEEADPTGRRHDRSPRNRDRDRERRGPRKPDGRKDRPDRNRDRRSPRPPDPRRDHGPQRDRREETPVEPLAVSVRFLPHQKAFENVIAQIKSAPIAYSVFALARLFLEKPERYDVRLTMPEGAPPSTPETSGGGLFQLGENGAVAADRRLLENSAFASLRDDFYTVEVT